MRFLDRRRVEALCGPTTVYHIVSEILPWAVFLGTVIALAAGWKSIPELVPMHADARGSITDWGAKGNLIWLCGVYLGTVLLLWIIGYFPRAWSRGVRLRILGRRLQVGQPEHSALYYRVTRDLMCDMRISMSVLFSAMLLLTAFYRPGPARHMFTWGIWVLLGVPLLRYAVRLVIKR